MLASPRPRAVLVVAAMTFASLLPSPAAATPITLSGAVYEDTDGDGIRDPGEPGWGGKGVYVHDLTSGDFVASTATAADGSYVIEGLPAGSYSVRYSAVAWRDVRDAWVPTTTDGVWPVVELDAQVDAEVDFGWRRITRSTSLSAPVTSVTAADGLRVQSFTDAVTAQEIEAALRSGSFIGAEAPYTTVRFGYSSSSYCGTSVSGGPGSYTDFAATCYVSYSSWLDRRDEVLFHEYGHAWSLYHDHIVQQDGTLSSYLEFRGLTGDPRLGTSHAWSPREMIAEDYRQLFGSPTAAAATQENRDIPAADDVPGLRTFLADTFTSAPPSEPAPDPSPSPDPDPSPSPDPDPSPSPEPEPTPSPDPEPDPEPSPDPEPEPSPEPTAEPAVMVTDLRGQGHSAKGGSWVVEVTVEARQGQAPAVGSQVSLVWLAPGRHGGSGTWSCTTTADGRCVVAVEFAKRVDVVEVRAAAPETAPGVDAVTIVKP